MSRTSAKMMLTVVRWKRSKIDEGRRRRLLIETSYSSHFRWLTERRTDARVAKDVPSRYVLTRISAMAGVVPTTMLSYGWPDAVGMA